MMEQPAREWRSVPDPPVRHVVILNDFGWVNGGQSKIAIDSALELQASGIAVCFVAGTGPIDDRLRDSGVECHVVAEHDILSDPNRLRAATSGIWNCKTAKTVAKCIKARDPSTTVVHVHGWAKSLSPSIGPVVTQAKAAHVYTLHEYFLACPNGGFYDYQANAICRRRALGADCLTTRCDPRGSHHKAWRVVRQVALWTLGRMPSDLRELIYLAPEQRQILESYMPAEARWHYLPNPVGPRPSNRIPAERNDTFLFVGRLSPEKGGLVAAEAAREAGVRIAFAGDGEQREEIVRTNPDARMLGWISQERVDAEMRHARALLFPSLWYETYGLAVADAVRAGLPVLVSRSSVAASLVGNGLAGEHIPAGDVQSWGRAMGRMASNELVRSYSEWAFDFGRKFSDHATSTARLIDIYGLALARRQGQARTSVGVPE